jgi:phytoene desaturase
MYAGLAPDSALALYAVITHMDTSEGVWFREGGIHAVPNVMAQVAEKAGVTFRYGETVNALLRSPTGRVAGVRTTSGERVLADAVVCTLDLPTAYQQLLSDLGPPRAVRRGQYSPAAIVWHVGVRGVPEPPVVHHNIHFGEEWSGPTWLLHLVRPGTRAEPDRQDQLGDRGAAEAGAIAHVPCRAGISQ